MKNVEEIKNYFIKEIEQNELMSKNHRKVSTISNYPEHFLILVSGITGCISISTITFLLVIPIGIRSSVMELKICAIIKK